MAFTKEPGRPLLAEILSREFSPDQARTRRTVGALYSVLMDPANSSGLQTPYERWARFFTLATEYQQRMAKQQNNATVRRTFEGFGLATARPDLGRFVFVIHTFTAILAKLLAFAAVSPAVLSNPLKEWALLADGAFAEAFVELENGSPFMAAGLRNFLHDDLFGWYPNHFTSDLLDGLRTLVAHLAEYDGSFLRSGDEPTGDLFKLIYLRLVSPALRKGLGEFYTPDWLAQHLLDLLDEGHFRGEPDRRLLDPACGSGTFLLLAINAVQRNPRSRAMDADELLRKICGNIVGIDLNPLAVIAARANYVLALGPLLRRRGKEPLEIPVYLGDSIRIPSLSLRGPGARLSQPQQLEMGKDAGNSPTSVDEERAAAGTAAGRAETLGGSSEAAYEDPFDYVVGNPPWIGWENLPEDYRHATKDLWHEHGLFVHRGMDTILGKGKKDLSMLMTYVAAEHYLKEGGRLGFVITQAVFKMAGAGQGFRRFVTRSQVPLCCERVEDYSGLRVFEGAQTKTALCVIHKGEKQTYPVPYLVVGTKACLVSREQWQAEPSDPGDPTSPWLTGNPLVLQAIRKVLGRSDYQAHQGVNTGGANAVFWFERLAEEADGDVIARNLVGAAKRKIKSQSIPLEAVRLFPLLRGHDVAAWRAKPSAWLLFVQDSQTRRGIAESEMARTPKTWRWLRQNERLLLQRAAYKRFFKPETAPFWTMFDVGDYTLKPWKVVWPRIASRLEAAVASSFSGKILLPQETLSFVGLEDEAEAFYVAGVINATPFRLAVSAFSQPGSKSFGTPSILERARIPRFDPASVLHQEISGEAKRLSRQAPEPGSKAHARLDSLCRNLWGLTNGELEAIQQAQTS